jgi:hypothetical protein
MSAAATAALVEGKVIQVAGPAVDVQFPDGQVLKLHSISVRAESAPLPCSPRTGLCVA